VKAITADVVDGKYITWQERRQWGGNCPPNCESRTNNFQVNQAFGVQAKAILQCKSTKLHKEPILLQLLIEPDQGGMVYQLSMIYQTLRIVQMLENSCRG